MLEFFKGTVTPKDWAFVGAVLGVTGLLCAGFYFAVFKSQQAKRDAAQSTLAQTTQELREAREIKVKFDEFKVEAEKASRLVELFEERLPEEREIPRLLAQFEKKGDDLGLSVELTQLPTMTDANKETIPYEIVARGDFHAIVKFINLLERDQRYLKVSNLDIREEVAGVSEATFQLSTFRFIQRTETASVAAK